MLPAHAGGPQATVGLEIDTLNPSAVYSSEIIAPNQADGVASDADSVVAYTVDFSEPVSGIGGGDINVEGGTLVPEPCISGGWSSGDI